MHGASLLAAVLTALTLLALLAFPALLTGEPEPKRSAQAALPEPSVPDPTQEESELSEQAELPDPGSTEGPAAPSTIRWRRSEALGKPYDGRLVQSVQLPAEGEHFFTWDPIRRTSPNRGWRRYGTDRLLRALLQVLSDFRRTQPDAPRVGIADLSRPHGGDFGPRFGSPGHASHQNGLDVDVYYPRSDGIERAPPTPASVDRRFAQDLVDRFVKASAQFVFVGFRVGLHGPRRTVQRIPRHENHLHVRIHNLP